MKKVAIVVGHGPRIDHGAVNADGTNELDWNRELAKYIGIALEGRVEYKIISREIERLSPIEAVNAYGADLAIELHLNASDDEDPDLEGTASGTEMIVYERSEKAKVAAKFFLDAAVGVLGLPNRGVKPPYEGRGNRFLSRTTMPAIIVESFFIDKSSDLRIGNQRKVALAKAYADAIATILQ